jgi:beta-mannanase
MYWKNNFRAMLAVTFILLSFSGKAQLKFLVEDFEGFADGTADLKANGVFTYGNIDAYVDYNTGMQRSYSGQRYLKMNRSGSIDFGGWGKGISMDVELDAGTDYFNFYVLTNDTNTIRIELQEDDNGDDTYTKDDDCWITDQLLAGKNKWELISIPLNRFKDGNYGGDGKFNADHLQGKLLCMVITSKNKKTPGLNWCYDFICFSKGKLPTGAEIFDAPANTANNFCCLGIWSKEGNLANFTDIAVNFEQNFKYGTEKKPGVIHFFQPFATDGGDKQNLYPSVDRINKVIENGYVPMITLEDHFVNVSPGMQQPNLYSITEGHFDNFFTGWANEIRQVKGTVLLRILHEFNGDWYPWCLANNDKDPKLLIKAFRHIHDIFTKQEVTNVKFIWCPNSMSWPQKSWNFIMDAYPGDDYVDYVALDIYNGAGNDRTLWRSFRKEGISNYFILTEHLPNKTLFVCETASREREHGESTASQNKGEWIIQMSEALGTDMSNIRLLAWFNEKKTFNVTSSQGSQGAFLDYILKSDHFKSGTAALDPLLGKK